MFNSVVAKEASRKGEEGLTRGGACRGLWRDGIKAIDRPAFEGVESVEVGMAFEAKATDGTAQHIVVTKVEGDEVTDQSQFWWRRCLVWASSLV